MHWQLKSAVFRALSAVPGHETLHLMAQKHLMKTLPRRSKNLEALYAKAEQFVSIFQQHSNKPLKDCNFLEIGSGRDLSVPLALRALGVGRVITLDIERLARLEFIQHAANIMAQKAGKAPAAIPTWKALSDIGIEYLAPATVHGVQSQVDCFVSNEVMEHIPPQALTDIMQRAATLSPDTGMLAIHAIDYSDHYARTDSRIDRFNFLQYSDERWRPYNHRSHYVNRLRPSEFGALFSKAGWDIIGETRKPWPHPITTRDSISAQFSRYSDEDLFSINGVFVLCPNGQRPK